MNNQIIRVIGFLVVAAVIDYDAYYQAKKADPELKYEAWPLIKRLVMGSVAAFGVEVTAAGGE